MKLLKLTARNTRQVVRVAIQVLRRGGVVVYPTETAYALGVDATRKSAVAKIFAIKGRHRSKHLSVLMANTVMAREYTYCSPVARRLWKRFLPGPLTLVVSGKRERTIGIRVSSHPFALSLVGRFGKPITATSANRSGNTPLRDPHAIIRAFFFARAKPDLIIDAGVLPKRRASTVVDCIGESVRVLRKGPITIQTLRGALKKKKSVR